MKNESPYQTFQPVLQEMYSGLQIDAWVHCEYVCLTFHALKIVSM